MVSAELQRRTVLSDAEERRPHRTARLLPGEYPQPTRGSALFTFLDQAGIGTYTSSVLKTPIIESVTKLRDKMVARNLGDHVKGLSFLPRVPQSPRD